MPELPEVETVREGVHHHAVGCVIERVRILDERSIRRHIGGFQLPFQPVCRETCQGLCSECGARLEEDPGHHHEVLDPRWSALQGLLSEDTEN